MTKRIFGFLLTLVMVLSLAACGNGGDEAPAANETETTSESSDSNTSEGDTTEEAVEAMTGKYPDETVLIAVEIYDPTDSEFLAMKDYFDYLAETFNVEFKFSEAIKDAEHELKFIEDSAVAGAKGFMAYYNVTGEEQLNKVFEYEMYYFGMAENEEIYAKYKEHPLYIGGTNTGDLNYQGGVAMGRWVVEQGFDTVIYSSGGADFGVPQFVNRQNGFYKGLGDADVEVVVVAGFPNEQFFADQAAALGTEGLDAVVASFNGVDFWAQPIATAGLEECKLATFGSVNQAYVDAFNNGSVDLVISGNIQSFGVIVPLVVNAVDGNVEVLQESGYAINAPVDGWVVDSAELCQKLLDIQNDERVYSADTFKQLVVNINPDANSELVQSTIDQGRIENLVK